MALTTKKVSLWLVVITTIVMAIGGAYIFQKIYSRQQVETECKPGYVRVASQAGSTCIQQDF